MTATWVLAGAALLILAILRRRFTTATVRGTSMSPTFADGDRVLAARRREYVAGDVIVFRTRRRELGWRIKRVNAVAGDPRPPWMPGTEKRVPPGCVVVVGDGSHSQDSRQLGYIPRARIAGRVIRVLSRAGTPVR